MADTPDLGKMWKQLTDSVGGGMSEALEKLKNSTIGEQVQSWIGKGENKPVTPEQVREAALPWASSTLMWVVQGAPPAAAESTCRTAPPR